MPSGRLTISRIAVPAATATVIDPLSPTRNSMVLRVVSGGPVYVGDSPGVTTANGFPLASGETLTLASTEPVYVITALTVTADLAVLEEET